MTPIHRLFGGFLLVLALAGTTMARAQTPVERHGQLRVEGNRLLGAHGRPAVLRGMSLFWSQWKGGFYNADAVRWLADDWRVDVIRVAVAVEPGGYLNHPEREWRKADRAIVLLGVTSASIPEFVTGTFLVVVVGVQLKLFPVIARAPAGSDLLTELYYLIMPATAMAIVYFGYIARMTRAGAIDVLESDYVRTATMKGLTTGQVMRRHVLRNALIPTVAVIGVQIGYLFGGIIGVERIFNYNGMGQLMLFAAQRKDLPVLQAGAVVIGIVYMLATLIADLVIAWMNPRVRTEAAS